jgi:hypothetical protein
MTMGNTNNSSSDFDPYAWAYYVKAWHHVAEQTRYGSARFVCGLWYDARESSISGRRALSEDEIAQSGRDLCPKCLESYPAPAPTP